MDNGDVLRIRGTKWIEIEHGYRNGVGNDGYWPRLSFCFVECISLSSQHESLNVIFSPASTRGLSTTTTTTTSEDTLQASSIELALADSIAMGCVLFRLRRRISKG